MTQLHNSQQTMQQQARNNFLGKASQKFCSHRRTMNSIKYLEIQIILDNTYTYTDNMHITYHNNYIDTQSHNIHITKKQ